MAATKTTEKPTLGYWDIRGLAQSVRMLLAHCSVDYEEVQYVAKPNAEGNGWDRSDWYGVKNDLGMFYPNLPYWWEPEENQKITQSNAVLMYCAGKYGLHDNLNGQEIGEVCMHLGQIMDLRNKAVTLFYVNWSEENLKDYVEKVTKIFEQFSSVLVGRSYLIGDKLSAADFHMAEMIYQHRLLDPSIFNSLSGLVRYQEKIFNLPGVCDLPDNLPVNNRMAFWGDKVLHLPEKKRSPENDGEEKKEEEGMGGASVDEKKTEAVN